jgi:type I restriction enzyme S subunit
MTKRVAAIVNSEKGIVKSGWRECTLRELIQNESAALQTGPFGTMLKASEYTDIGTAVIAVQDIGENIFHSDRLKFINAATAMRLKSYQVLTGDIIFGRKGAVDRRAIVTPRENGWIQGSDCIRLRLGKGLDSKFISYQLGSKMLKEWLNQHAHGATMPSLNQEILALLPLYVPPLTEQHAIAGVLSSLDDKIDLLRRQNKTLEAMAEALFRQWFIEEAGEGCENARLSSIAKHLKEGASPQDNASIQYYHYSIPAFDDRHQPVIEFGTEIQSNKYKVYPGTILVSKLNPRFPRIWAIPSLIDENSICSTEFQVVSPISPEWYGFIYCLMSSKSVIDELAGAAGGTSGSHQRVKLEDIFNVTFSKPDMGTLSRFNKLLDVFLFRLFSNYASISNIESLRDTLLPKLMSGEVRLTR